MKNLKTYIPLFLIGALVLSGCSVPSKIINNEHSIKEESKVEINGETASTTNETDSYIEKTQPSQVVSNEDSENEDRESDDEGEDDMKTNAAAPVPVPAKSGIITTEKTYTMAEIGAANTVNKCWTVVSGNVYDLTSYVQAHKGGASAIRSLCGKDGTAAFSGQHGGQSKPAYDLSKLFIGKLK